jgi:hypothetical protein
MTRRSWPLLIAVWALVLVPLGWGVTATAKKAWMLFAPAPAAAPSGAKAP